MKSDGHFRIHLFLGLISLSFGLIFYQLFVLSYVKHSLYAQVAAANIDHVSNILARGNIYFSDKVGQRLLAATNKKFAVVTVIPSKIEIGRRNDVASSLASVTGASLTSVEKTLASGGENVKVVARRLSDDQVKKIKELQLPGVSITYEMDRFYPNEGIAADILGFLGYDGFGRAGQYGIEAAYNAELFGKSTEADSTASLAESWFKRSKKTEAIIRPNDIVLTIDQTVQQFVEERLDTLLKQWNATSGSILVQDPITGKMLAIADRPTFNPNSYSSSEAHTFLNTTLQEIFEPGSSFKPFTIAAGLDLGKITPQTTFEDKGFVEIDSYKIKNFSERVFGRVSMSQVLELSINTGTMFVENLIGNDNFANYVINMGFGQKTGVDLPGEVNGDISNLYSGRKINFLTASFGQGIAVTALQLVNAYSTIANGGKLMKPYVVEKIISEGGKATLNQPEIIGIPISEKTSQRVTNMLVDVVQKGFDNARISGYKIAGKTGTAQIPDGQGGYLEDQYIHNFVGFAPADTPRFTILIKIDKPQGITFAADSLSPAFRDISAFLLKYYNIPPQQ